MSDVCGSTVRIDGELLTRDSGTLTVLAVSVGPSLVHASVDAGLADWTGHSGILEGERGVEGVLLVPSHDRWAWVSCHQMHVVV